MHNDNYKPIALYDVKNDKLSVYRNREEAEIIVKVLNRKMADYKVIENVSVMM